MRSLKRTVGVLGAAFGLLTLAPVAEAHHSYAMFDAAKQLTLAGTVAKFDWANPHVSFDLVVNQADGSTKLYTIECASPNVLSRHNWKFNTIKEGDKVSILINPLRDGRDGGQLDEATLADGRVFSNVNPPVKQP